MRQHQQSRVNLRNNDFKDAREAFLSLVFGLFILCCNRFRRGDIQMTLASLTTKIEIATTKITNSLHLFKEIVAAKLVSMVCLNFNLTVFN